MKALTAGERLQNKIIAHRGEDAVRLMGDNIVIDNTTIIDKTNSNDAHRDAFQLIPTIKNLPNRQYAAASIKRPRITRCSIHSTGALQGIFSSDGMVENAQITDNVIDTCSAHSITINGLMSGDVSRNYYGDGSPLPVVLNNLRIGGGIANIWVKSFKHHEYEAVKGEHILDNRGTDYAGNGLHVENLDLDLFRSKVNEIKYIDLKQWCLALGDLAIACSD